MPQLRGDIELLVLDNCSALPVESTLPLELRERAKIIRHPTNIGACANIVRCFEIASGEWIWILCDDDTPAADAIDRILNETVRHADCAMLDFGHPFSASKADVNVATGASEAIESMYFQGGQCRSYAWSDGHASNEVFNRRRLLPLIGRGYQYIYTFYPHVAMVFSALCDGGKVTFMGPLIATPRTHNEAARTYTFDDIKRGWRQLAEIFPAGPVRKRYLTAICSGVYGTHDAKVYGNSGMRWSFRRALSAILPKNVKALIRRVYLVLKSVYTGDVHGRG